MADTWTSDGRLVRVGRTDRNYIVAYAMTPETAEQIAREHNACGRLATACERLQGLLVLVPRDTFTAAGQRNAEIALEQAHTALATARGE